MVCGGLACHDLSGLAGTQALPAGISNPNTYNTPAGALALYNGVISAFQMHTDTAGSMDAGVFVNFVLSSGLLTDELQSGNLGGNQLDYSAVGVTSAAQVDVRQLPEGVGVTLTDGAYSDLQGLRNSAGIASDALAAYDTLHSPALRGMMYALQGYSEIFLADLFCAGVPLSTLDYHGDFTQHAGSTTPELYQAAVAKFDTALTLSRDSARILDLARVGKGRALLNLGQYAAAAAAVDSVPPDYAYQFVINWAGSSSDVLFVDNGSSGSGKTAVDSEGNTGLPYLSSHDPRSAASSRGTNLYHVPQYIPNKYGGATPGLYPITVASGIEARLIQAEAAYHGVATGTGSWLDQLNALRQTAIAPALPALTDPGTDSARVAMIFRERALWLYVTGHRQGDLRRLIRQYPTVAPSADAVYPTGVYPLFGALSRYGTDVTAPIPTAEHINPLFTGCLSRGA
jgi:hypothetical protein